MAQRNFENEMEKDIKKGKEKLKAEFEKKID
jgi:hypothetical protein